jgi:hypothetical protein
MCWRRGLCVGLCVGGVCVGAFGGGLCVHAGCLELSCRGSSSVRAAKMLI